MKTITDRRLLWIGSNWAFCLWLLGLLTTFPAQAQVHTGDLTLSTQAQVDTFAYSQVTGILRIQGSDITNLNALSGLTLVGGLRIEGNAALRNLVGLDSLT